MELGVCTLVSPSQETALSTGQQSQTPPLHCPDIVTYILYSTETQSQFEKYRAPPP